MSLITRTIEWFDRGRLRSLLVLAGCLLARPDPTGTLVGWAVVAAGACLHVWARGCLRINLELTTSGPYRWVRNPFYLANGLIDLGLCLVIARPWLTLVYLTLWTLAYRRTIRREHATLHR